MTSPMNGAAAKRDYSARLGTRISSEVARRLHLAKAATGRKLEEITDQALDKGLPTVAELLSQISDGERNS